MAIIHKYTLLCDEIRQENNGKFLVLGLYTPDIVVPSLPFALPVLSFFNYLEADGPGQWDMSFRLSHSDSVLAGGSGKISSGKAGVIVIPLRLGPIVFQAAGEYVFTLDIGGVGAQVQFPFSVMLNVPQAPAAPSKAAIH